MRHYQRDDLLTASEIARYIYCQRAWSYDQLSPRKSRFTKFVLGAATVLVVSTLFILILNFGL